MQNVLEGSKGTSKRAKEEDEGHEMRQEELLDTNDLPREEEEGGGFEGAEG